MSFSSLIFIALFLPVFMIGSVFVRGNQRKNLLLLLFSLVFYAFAGLSNLALLLVMTTIAWFIGQRIGRATTFSRVRTRSGPASRVRSVPARGSSSRSCC